MNFDKLPCDIKRVIFDYNREAAQIENNKKRYSEVMGELCGHSCGFEIVFNSCPRNRTTSYHILENISVTRFDKWRRMEEEKEEEEEWRILLLEENPF